LPPKQPQRVFYTVAIVALILLLSFIGGIRLFPILFIVLVIRSCFIFKPRVCLVVTGIALVLCILVQTHRFQFLTLSPALTNPNWLKQIWLGSIFLAGLTLVFLQLLMFAVLSERQSREQLLLAHARLRHYALEIENLATVQERNRIAREIHDSLGHSLTVFNLHLEAALRLLQSHPEDARELLIEAKHLSATALQEVRQSVAALRSNPLQGRSLKTAIATLIEDFQRSTGITPHFCYQVAPILSPKLEVAIYRIVQEAFTNICKYAAATQVELLIQADPQADPQADQMVRVTVQDNGTGFDPNQTTTGFGLQGMQERTLALSGQFKLTTAPTAGCRIDAAFPLNNCP
jgi:signal transduction histidine kinase